MLKKIKELAPNELESVINGNQRAELYAAFGCWLPKLQDGSITKAFAKSLCDRISETEIQLKNLQAVKQHYNVSEEEVRQREAESLVEVWRSRFTEAKFNAIKAAIMNAE
jgi:hypothetical protein